MNIFKIDLSNFKKKNFLKLKNPQQRSERKISYIT